MHDTDMAGILYFPRQFRFAHDALEDFLEHEGITFDQLFRRESFAFVIRHAEADYLIPLKVADRLDIHLRITHIGDTSFTIFYEIYLHDGVLAGTAKTVHVCLDSKTRKKIPVPHKWRQSLEKYFKP